MKVLITDYIFFLGGGRLFFVNCPTCKKFPDLKYFLLDIFNARASLISSFLHFSSKFGKNFIYRLQNLETYPFLSAVTAFY